MRPGIFISAVGGGALGIFLAVNHISFLWAIPGIFVIGFVCKYFDDNVSL
jgi:hypothetical protein